MDVTPRTAAAAGGFAASGQTAPFNIASVTPGAAFIASVVTSASGTTPSLTAYLDISDVGGNWVAVAALPAQTSAGVQSAIAQVGTANPNLTNIARIRWTVTGTGAQFAGQIFATAAG